MSNYETVVKSTTEVIKDITEVGLRLEDIMIGMGLGSRRIRQIE